MRIDEPGQQESPVVVLGPRGKFLGQCGVRSAVSDDTIGSDCQGAVANRLQMRGRVGQRGSARNVEDVSAVHGGGDRFHGTIVHSASHGRSTMRYEEAPR